jgi:hypothetical protein
MMWVKADSRIFARSFQPAASPKALTRISGDIRSLALKDRQPFRGKKFSALAFAPNQVDDAGKINAALTPGIVEGIELRRCAT